MNKKWFNFLLKGSTKYSKLFLACSLSFLAVEQIQAKPSEKSVAVEQQARLNIAGKVVDNNGEAVIGASVSVKGTTNGSMTDIDGNFTLNNVPSDAVLVVTYLGYETQEVSVAGKNQFNITLKENSQILDEVVVQVGYGQVKRANLLGAVATMTTEEIQDIPAASISETLAGRLAGVTTSINTGKVGETTRLSIRKPSSYSSGAQQVLFIIDGIERNQSDFDLLDPSQIESFSVLKDAAAAVYGVRSAGGVIVVKTKLGQEGKPKITYAGTFGTTNKTTIPKLMSSVEHAKYLNDQLDTDNNRYNPNFINLPLSEFRQNLADDVRLKYFTDADIDEIAGRTNYNMLDDMWSSAEVTKHTLSLSGGNKDIKYFGSTSYFKQNGNIGNLNVTQYTFRLGVEAKITEGLKARFIIDTNRRDRKAPYTVSDSSNTETMRYTFSTLYRTPTWMPLYVEGKPVYFEGNGFLPLGQNNGISHPLAVIESGSYDKTISTATTFNFGFTYDVKQIKGLSANVNYARTEDYSNQRQYRLNYELFKLANFEGSHLIPSETELTGTSQIIENGDRLSLSNSRSSQYQFNAAVNYVNKFDKHSVNAMFNYEEQGRDGENFNAFREDMAVPNSERFDAFTKVPEVGNGYSLSARRSYIGRLNYDFDSKYLLESSFRYEATYKFPPHSRWGFFPSVSLGWRISEENWFRDNVNFMDNLKLRASVGKLGDEGSVPRQWERSWQLQAKAGYLGGAALSGLVPYLSGLVNDALIWETTMSYNLGVDARFFNHFDLGFDFWRKNTVDVIDTGASDLPSTLGVGAAGNKVPARNYGEMSSWGTELTLGYNGKIGKDIKYNVGGNIAWSDSYVKKKIQNLGNVGTILDEEGRRSDSGIIGFKSLGIIRTQEQLDQINAENNAKYGKNLEIFGKPAQVGMLYYEDLNGDGVITDKGIEDKARLEDFSSNPYAFGFNFGFSWKSLSFVAQFSGGFGGNAVISKYDVESPTYALNGLAMLADHWTPDNTNASMPRAATIDSYQVSSFWVRNGAEFRWRAATLSYAVPKNIASKLKVADIRVFATGTNLLTFISPYDYKDPALSYYYSYPILRSFNFGLNLAF